MPPPENLTLGEALRELEGLASAIARGATPHRDVAMRYTRCRDALLHSRLARALPGFLLQCTSVEKLRTFVTLYHLDKRVREEFLDEAFAPAREMLVESTTRRASFGFDSYEL
jgi:hypothetical protein